MQLHALSDDILYRHTGIQGGVRVLEDHLHVRRELIMLFSGLLIDILAFKVDMACCRRIQLDNASAGCRFSAAGLSDQAYRLTFVDVEGDIVDRLQRGILPTWKNLLMFSTRTRGSLL